MGPDLSSVGLLWVWLGWKEAHKSLPALEAAGTGLGGGSVQAFQCPEAQCQPEPGKRRGGWRPGSGRWAETGSLPGTGAGPRLQDCPFPPGQHAGPPTGQQRRSGPWVCGLGTGGQAQEPLSRAESLRSMHSLPAGGRGREALSVALPPPGQGATYTWPHSPRRPGPPAAAAAPP